MEGSKTLTLALTATMLFAKLKKQSYYLGEALKSNPQIRDLAAKIQASDDEDDLIQDLIHDGATKVGNILSREIGNTTSSWDITGKTAVTYTIKTVANFMDSQNELLKETMLKYISSYVLSEWLSLIKPDESVRFGNMLKEYEDDIKTIGSMRSKPAGSIKPIVPWSDATNAPTDTTKIYVLTVACAGIAGSSAGQMYEYNGSAWVVYAGNAYGG